MTKKSLYHWHRKLGLTLGFVLFLMGLSGSILTFRDELLPVVYADLLAVEARGERAPLITQFQNVRAYAPEATLSQYYTAEADDTASLVLARAEGSWLPLLIAVNPYTAEVRGSMPLAQNIFGVMLYLHANLFLGKIGSYIVGFLGFVTVGFIVSGLILWWPKTKAWVAKLRGLSHGVRGLHRSLGILFALPLAFSAVTGLMLAFDATYHLGRKSKPKDVIRSQTCSFEQQLNTLSLLTPEQEKNLVSFHFCGKKNGLVKLTYGHHARSGHDGYVRLLVDPLTNNIEQRFDTRTDPASWSANSLWTYPLHTGASFGPLGRWISLLTGLALTTLYLTGLWPTFRKIIYRRKDVDSSSPTQRSYV